MSRYPHTSYLPPKFAHRCISIATRLYFSLPSQTPPLLPSLPPPSSSTNIDFQPREIKIILEKLKCVGFDLPSTTRESPRQTILDACSAKAQLLLEEGIDLRDVKRSLKQHPDALLKTSNEQLASVLRLLNSVGLSGKTLGKIILQERRLFRAATESFESKLSVFESSRIEQKVAKSSFVVFPYVLTLNVEKLEAGLQCLRHIGMSEEAISTILCRYPRFFYLRMEDRVKPMVEYLQRCGLEGDVLCAAIARYPFVFEFSDVTRSERIRFLQRLGFNEHTCSIARVFLLLSSVGQDFLENTVDLLRSRGLSFDEIGQMVSYSPIILFLSVENISKKIDFLANVLKRDIKELLKYPRFLSHSLEKRIIPRFNALAETKEEELFTIGTSLNSVVGFPEQKFQKMLLNFQKQKEQRRQRIFMQNLK